MSNEMTGKNGEKLSKMWLAPLIIMIAVVPLITIIHVYDCGLEKNAWFSAGGRLNDFFLYYKALAILSNSKEEITNVLKGRSLFVK